MNVYDIITERILKKLEGGTVPWRKPWQGGDAGIPRNVVTGFPYRGINVFLLAAAGYASPYWLTFRQAKRRGGNVRKGEHGTPVIFWKWRDPEDGEHGGEDERAIPVLRYYLVFNVEQCDGVAIPVTSLAPQRAFAPIRAARSSSSACRMRPGSSTGEHTPPTCRRETRSSCRRVAHSRARHPTTPRSSTSSRMRLVTLAGSRGRR